MWTIICIQKQLGGRDFLTRGQMSEIVLISESDLKQVNGEYCKVVMWIIKTWLEGEGRQQQIYRSPPVSSIKKNRCFPKFIAVIRKEWMYSETTAFKFKKTALFILSLLSWTVTMDWTKITRSKVFQRVFTDNKQVVIRIF